MKGWGWSQSFGVLLLAGLESELLLTQFLEGDLVRLTSTTSLASIGTSRRDPVTQSTNCRIQTSEGLSPIAPAPVWQAGKLCG